MISPRTSAQQRNIITRNGRDLDFKFVWTVCAAEYVSLEAVAPLPAPVTVLATLADEFLLNTCDELQPLGWVRPLEERSRESGRDRVIPYFSLVTAFSAFGA